MSKGKIKLVNSPSAPPNAKRKRIVFQWTSRSQDPKIRLTIQRRTDRLVSHMAKNLDDMRKIWGDSLEAAQAEGREMSKPSSKSNKKYFRKMADAVVPFDHREDIREDYAQNPAKYIKVMESRCRE